MKAKTSTSTKATAKASTQSAQQLAARERDERSNAIKFIEFVRDFAYISRTRGGPTTKVDSDSGLIDLESLRAQHLPGVTVGGAGAGGTGSADGVDNVGVSAVDEDLVLRVERVDVPAMPLPKGELALWLKDGSNTSAGLVWHEELLRDPLGNLASNEVLLQKLYKDVATRLVQADPARLPAAEKKQIQSHCDPAALRSD